VLAAVHRKIGERDKCECGAAPNAAHLSGLRMPVGGRQEGEEGGGDASGPRMMPRGGEIPKALICISGA